MADKASGKDEREQSARKQLAEIKDRVETRLTQLAEQDKEVKRDIRSLERKLSASETQRGILDWIFNGDPATEEAAEESEVGEAAEEESEGSE